MPSTGRSARRVTSQVTPATTTSSSGRPTTIAVRTSPTACCWVSSGKPAYTVTVSPVGVVASTPAKR
jgi:hypothetical protein